MFSSSIRFFLVLDKILRMPSSIFFIFCSLSLLLLINQFLLVSSWDYILLITTLVSCSSRPFSLTVKLTRITLVVTSGLYLGLGSFVVMKNLKFSLYLIYLSPKYNMYRSATFLIVLLSRGSSEESISSSRFCNKTICPLATLTSIVFIQLSV